MISIDLEFRLPADVSTSFRILSDPRSDPHWQFACIEVGFVSGAGELGSTYRYVMNMMGRRLEFLNTITLLEPDTVMAYQVVEGPVYFAGRYDLSREGNAETAVRWHFELDKRDNFRVVPEALVRKAVAAQAIKDQKALAELVTKALRRPVTESGGVG